MVKVKICGITSVEDALAAKNLGPDCLGFVIEVPNAARSIERKEAKTIFEELKGEIPLVALTPLTEAGKITELCSFLQADAVQLLKQMQPKQLSLLRKQLPGVKIFQTIHVKGEKSIAVAKKFEKLADAIVLDAPSKNCLGGTGKKADWGICRKIAESAQKPCFLAGGLSPGNAEKAIRAVKPFGVDASSSLKKTGSKRKLDIRKAKAFIAKSKAM